jgi:hypothetical protein
MIKVATKQIFNTAEREKVYYFPWLVRKDDQRGSQITSATIADKWAFDKAQETDQDGVRKARNFN